MLSNTDVLAAWDVHSSLNALSLGVVPLSEQDGAPFFALGEHLKVVAQVVKADGWARAALAEAWVESFAGLRMVIGRRAAVCECTVVLPQSVEIELAPLIREIRGQWDDSFMKVRLEGIGVVPAPGEPAAQIDVRISFARAGEASWHVREVGTQIRARK